MGNRTVLYDWHKNAGAKYTEFGGWEMPVLYSSIVKEHLAVRNAAGLFDVCHMGKIFVAGKASLEYLQNICTNDISKCAPSQAMYSHICNEQGGVIDDIFVYCIEPDRYLVIVNAATMEKDFSWMMKNKIGNVEIENRSPELGMIALQGPRAQDVALKLFKQIPSRHRIALEKQWNETLYICRTGYTGEDGIEVVAPNAVIQKIWESFLEAGKGFSIVPCGLGARDTLRLEVGYLLYGQDVDEEHSSLEAGVGWAVSFSKNHFIGREALWKQKSEGLKRKLTAFTLTERGIPRHGSKIYCNGASAGVVTSGTFSPSLQYGVAMGYVPEGLEGHFSVECHSKLVPASIVRLPFYKNKK